MTFLWSPEIADDPYAFVLAVFPWGKLGTPLEKEKGPREWQRQKLLEIKKFIAEQKFRELNELLLELFQDATASGRGIGKSALVAWLILWFMSTKLGSTTIITANTESQLKSRTWAELGRWHTLSLNAHWFDRGAMKLKPQPWFEHLLKTKLQIDTGYYYAEAQLWSEETPDAFAGAHNPLGMMLIMDEASGIPEKIWSVSKGFFTEKKCPWRFWFVFSNPRRNTGAFFECFHKHREFWRTINIDGRTVEDTDPAVYDQIIKQYGEDSDEARIEVYGSFPRRGDNQFISRETIEDAIMRTVQLDPGAALTMGVDVARFGDDCTMIVFRQGRDARSIPSIKLKGKDNMQVANIVAEWIDKVNPDAVCIDSGAGTGVIDRLKERKYKVHEIQFGGTVEDAQWADKRTEIWAAMRDWLPGGCIPDEQTLKADLAAPWYEWAGKGSDRQKLVSKDKMKAKGFASPDHGDALALTFGVRTQRRDAKLSTSNPTRRNRTARDVDYPLFG